MLIEEEDILIAIDMLDRVSKDMPKIFAHYGETQQFHFSQRLLDFIASNGGKVKRNKALDWAFATVNKRVFDETINTLKTTGKIVTWKEGKILGLPRSNGEKDGN